MRPLQQHFHSLGLTNQCTASIRPLGFWPFYSGERHNLSCLTTGIHIWVFYSPQIPYQVILTQCSRISSAPLGSSVPSPQVMIAMDNTAVVTYINKQSGTFPVASIPGHSHQGHTQSWLQNQDIVIRAIHNPGFNTRT